MRGPSWHCKWHCACRSKATVEATARRYVSCGRLKSIDSRAHLVAQLASVARAVESEVARHGLEVRARGSGHGAQELELRLRERGDGGHRLRRGERRGLRGRARRRPRHRGRGECVDLKNITCNLGGLAVLRTALGV